MPHDCKGTKINALDIVIGRTPSKQTLIGQVVNICEGAASCELGVLPLALVHKAGDRGQIGQPHQSYSLWSMTAKEVEVIQPCPEPAAPLFEGTRQVAPAEQPVGGENPNAPAVSPA
jgi:hypothetical protein